VNDVGAPDPREPDLAPEDENSPSTPRRTGAGGPIFAVAALALCCAVPALIVVGAGLFAAVGGLAARYWPLTAIGVLALVWGAAELVRLLAARAHTLRGGNDRSG